MILVTGSGGLIGSAAVRYFCDRGHPVVGIDNNMRQYFFGAAGSTRETASELEKIYPGFRTVDVDIRDQAALTRVFSEHGADITAVIHTAAQPSHDWAKNEPITDFDVNARATLLLLEATRQHCPGAVFVFCSTNKVYGDNPNRLPLKEEPTRYEIADPELWNGIGEGFPIDACTHSLFGASKLAADIICQEYGRYFGMKTGVFRGGCLTGENHAGVMLHGFLSFLVSSCLKNRSYNVIGYGGKQVRDNIHADDLVALFDCFIKKPRPGAVYNIGGGRDNSCSVIEAISIASSEFDVKVELEFTEANRVGDHQWYISDLSSVARDFPEWSIQTSLTEIIQRIGAKATQTR